MTKKDIIRRFRKIGITACYSGSTKTFHLKHNKGEHYQNMLMNDVQNMGYKITVNQEKEKAA
jgi:hypothetical protein